MIWLQSCCVDEEDNGGTREATDTTVCGMKVWLGHLLGFFYETCLGRSCKCDVNVRGFVVHEEKRKITKINENDEFFDLPYYQCDAFRTSVIEAWGLCHLEECSEIFTNCVSINTIIKM